MNAKTQHFPTCCEWISLITHRIYHSIGYGVIYFLVLLTNLVLLIWLVKDKGTPRPLPLFVSLEIGVTVALVCEILFTAKMQGLRAWIKDLSNWFDFLVAIVCLFSLIAYAIGEELQEEVAVAITSARYGAQTLRLGVLLRYIRRKSPQVLTGEGDIRFDEHNASGLETSPHNIEPNMLSPHFQTILL